MSTTPTRDDIRAAIFGSEESKIQKRLVQFFGAQVEVRQPTLGQILAAQQNPDRQAAVIDQLVANTYIPGTETKVFEIEDADQFKEMPFGDNFIRVSEAFEDMSSVNFREGEGAPEEESNTPAHNEAGVGTEAN